MTHGYEWFFDYNFIDIDFDFDFDFESDVTGSIDSVDDEIQDIEDILLW